MTVTNLTKAALTGLIGSVALASAVPAQARGHDDGAAIAVGAGLLGLAVGAAIASDHPYYGGYYAGPAYYPAYPAYYPAYPAYGYYYSYPAYRGYRPHYNGYRGYRGYYNNDYRGDYRHEGYRHHD